MVFDQLVVMLHRISLRQCTQNVKYEAAVLLLFGEVSQFVVTRLCKEKETQPVNVKSQLGTKAIVWIISSPNIFFSQVEFVFVHFI